MSKHVFRMRLALGWCVAVVMVGALNVVNDRTASTLANGLLLMIGLIPPAIMLLVWSGPPALTVAEVLHAAGEPSKENRR
jgi:hypothetical protein